ncbi:MAG: hypothetical protein RBT49_01150 [Bacteroidales bacterium]|jgi:hypothetical protein|nr:hypothetical protein [Bacteroidales bacterium]
MAESEIIKEIENFIDGKISNWYVGISNDAERRLKEHGVVLKPANTSWIYRKAPSDEIARKIEKYFHDKGADGDTGGGDNDCKFVYAYLKNGQTKP